MSKLVTLAIDYVKATNPTYGTEVYDCLTKIDAIILENLEARKQGTTTEGPKVTGAIIPGGYLKWVTFYILRQHGWDAIPRQGNDEYPGGYYSLEPNLLGEFK